MNVIAAASTVALFATQVNAHGYLSEPAANFENGIDTSYVAILTETSDPAFAGLKWNDNPVANVAMFAKSFPNSRFKTLKELMDTVASGCGKTLTTGAPVDVSSLSSMTWQNDQEQKGFIDSHHGPCEGWIDDKRVFHYDDCRAEFTSYPAKIPVDYSSCTGDCTFIFYWMPMHEPNWQVYKQCALITNGSGGVSQNEDRSIPLPPPTADALDTTQSSPTTDNSTSTDTVKTTSTDPVIASNYATTPTITASGAAKTPITGGATSTPASRCKTRRRLSTN